MRFRRLSYINAVLFVLSMTATVQSVAQAPQLDNGHLRLTFDPGTGQLTAFTDVRNQHEFVGPDPNDAIWRIDQFPSSRDGTITPSEAREFHWRMAEDNQRIELLWQGFDTHQAPDLRVVVTVALVKDEPTSLWHITAEGLPSMPIAIRFPRLSPIRPQEDEILAVPVWMGEQTSRTRELLGADDEQRLEWDYPGILSMQCMAFYRRNGPGLYVACDDTEALAKRFAVVGEKRRNIGIEVTQLPADREAMPFHYESPYRVMLGAFEGDWFTAAERYRAWALRQSWAQQSRLKRGDVADWATKTAVWVWNRGRSEDVLGPALALQERAHLPVSVFWHWWHGCAYDMGFPEYLPPREGTESFQAAMLNARSAGVHALVYMNQRLWGMTTRSWSEENAERFAVKDPGGNVRPEVYNTFTKAPCASMCMGTAFWRNRYAGLAAEAVKGLGVDGIYMDQACSSLACYDPTHGHPLGGGAYWMNGFRMLQADIRDRCQTSRKVVLAGEGCGEAWLPYLDLMLSLQVSMERYAQPGAWEPIPFFHSVYHGYALFYGNYSSLTMPPYDDLWPAEYAPKEPLKLLDRKFAGQFRLEQARAFVWGQQPTIANVRPSHFDDRADEWAYALRLAKLRYEALRFLEYGTMLRPPVITAPEQTIEMSRLSIYAGQQEALKQYRKSCPSVLASAWRAPDDAVAIVLANITDTPQTVTLNLDKATYPIAEGSRMYSRDEDGRKHVGEVQGGPVQIRIALEPVDACIYEFETPSTGPQL